MNKKLLTAALLLLSLLLAFSACADDKKGNGGDRAVISAADSGIVSDGLIPESELPQSTAIRDWYEESKSRELLPYALLYAKDESDGKWHCWLYVGTWHEGDKLSLGSLTADGFCVVMDYVTEATDPETGAEGAFHFSFSCTGEPSFEFSVNGDSDGLITTVLGTSVAP